MAPAAAPEPSYRKDEKVYCFHHELLYEAKVLEVRPAEGDDKKSGFQYRVHYKGWKNTYVYYILVSASFYLLVTDMHLSEPSFTPRLHIRHRPPSP